MSSRARYSLWLCIVFRSSIFVERSCQFWRLYKKQGGKRTLHEHMSSEASFFDLPTAEDYRKFSICPPWASQQDLHVWLLIALIFGKISGAVRIISNTWCLHCVGISAASAVIWIYVPYVVCSLLYRPTNAQHINNEVCIIKYMFRHINIIFRGFFLIYAKVTILLLLLLSSSTCSSSSFLRTNFHCQFTSSKILMHSLCGAVFCVVLQAYVLSDLLLGWACKHM